MDICSSGEVFRIAANVNCVLWLIYTDIVDTHRSWERDTLQINPTKVEGKTKVGYDILVDADTAYVNLKSEREGKT